jgi:hypothetical protein
MSFASDLLRFGDKVMETYVKVRRESAFDLFSAIVIETPVDKGVLANNWFVGLGAGSVATTDTSDPGHGSTLSRIEQTIRQVDAENEIFFTNNLPYAYPIEFGGHSAKAPQGMVRINTVRWETIVRNNLRRHGR